MFFTSGNLSQIIPSHKQSKQKCKYGGEKQLFFLNNWQNEHLLIKNPASRTGEVPYH